MTPPRFAALAALLAPSLAGAAGVTVADASVKFRPGDGPGPSTSAEIKAAKNEFEAFQVIVDGGSGGVTGVVVSAPTLVGPGGASIGGGEIRLYREAYLSLAVASNVEGGTG